MIEFVIATAFYALSMSITPGPTNIVMMSTGVSYGFRATIIFATGAAFGFTALVFVVALGLGTVLTENKDIMLYMGYGGALIISYMGYKIAFAENTLESDEKERPSFMEGAILQWINPKSWIACLAGVSAFSLAGSLERLTLYMCVYMVVGYLSVLTWGYAGAKISNFLKQENRLRIFNYFMGASLVIVAIYLAFMDQGI